MINLFNTHQKDNRNRNLMPKYQFLPETFDGVWEELSLF